ncbi:MAG TPA: PBP1A family penicillin-binding protein [Pyrinomonadaceae bacterium]|nr:PBP1A family penicillin-binding protein [Pyrinomonadaceae bacterium]
MRLKETGHFPKPAMKAVARGRLRRLVRWTIAILAVALISLCLVFAQTYRSYAKIVDARLAHGYLISRAGIYAAPRTLRVGQKYSLASLSQALRSAGYVESDSASEVWNGSFSVAKNLIEIRPSTAGGSPSTVRITIDGSDRISNLTGDDVSLESFTLAPESLTNDAFTKGGTRSQLAFTDIPPVLVQAITSIEDRRFFDHPGLDIFGVARALLRNAGDERIGQGGSTITQQLVKNTYLTPERTLRRKFAEAMLSFTIERRLSKQDIFALYCNEIFLGQRDAVAVRGVGQAARIYFGKELKDLTLAEAATIAGMIQSPARYSPIRQSEAARSRRNTVLGTMVRDGFITLDQAADSTKAPLTVANFDPARETVAPYFIDYVNRTVARGTSVAPVNQAQDERATVTTVDLDLQKLASAAIKHQLDRLDEIYKPRGVRPQAALVALDPKTGKVLAMIGGRDYAQSQLNRATDAERQPGSVFKPFVYAAALESGMSPLRMFKDAPQEFSYAHNQKYRPANYGGGFSMGDVPLRDGLIKSLNVVTVDVAMQTGLARVANTALSFGLPRPKPYPALALGTTEATPLQIAAAYAALANGGKRIQPLVVADAVSAAAEQVIAPSTAFMISDMLQGVIDHGTARTARGALKETVIAGKTGTSRDGWFVGYTPNLVCAVWIGFDDNKQLGLTGAEAALPAWVEFMKGAVDLRPELGGRSFDQPAGITIVEIDPNTDGLATGKCPSHERVAILSEQAPTSECFRHNIYFDLPDEAPPIENPALTKPETPRSARNRQKKSLPGELAALRDTQVSTDKQGRRVLLNEMRARER